MKLTKIIAFLVLIAYIPSFAFGMPVLLVPEDKVQSDSTCLSSQLRGRVDASKMHRSGNWFVGGFFSGVLLGLIGTGLTTAIAAASGPTPESVPEDEGIDMVCYVNGYEKKGRNKNILHTALGGLLGTAIFVTAYFTIIADDK